MLTEEKQKFLLEPFPLLGRLFEIYFVRLIGTPNQKFYKLVVQKITRFELYSESLILAQNERWRRG